MEARERRVASHASQVEDMVYRAFDKKPYWTLKELLKETNQPKVSHESASVMFMSSCSGGKGCGVTDEMACQIEPYTQC